MSAAFYDTLETRSTELREQQLLSALTRQVAHAKANAPAFSELLKDVDAGSITTRSALATLPVTRKHELLARQKAQRANDVFGGYSTIGWGSRRGALRVYASPGPIYEPEGRAGDYWRVARAIHAAGFRAGELAHNSFSYHFTPAGAMMETGAHALGCTVFPGGVGQTEQQVQAMAELQAVGYIGTPSFLKIILEKAAEMGIALPHLSKALVGGEAFPPSLRDWLAARGVAGYQCYATADLGLIAYETAAREGLVLDEQIIVEIVRPGTGEPVPEGEVGEVVVTTLNPDYPLIRFGTGDLSAVLPGHCPTGRTNTRIRGWLRRAGIAPIHFDGLRIGAAFHQAQLYPYLGHPGRGVPAIDLVGQRFAGRFRETQVPASPIYFIKGKTLPSQSHQQGEILHVARDIRSVGPGIDGDIGQTGPGGEIIRYGGGDENGREREQERNQEGTRETHSTVSFLCRSHNVSWRCARNAQVTVLHFHFTVLSAYGSLRLGFMTRVWGIQGTTAL